MSRLADAGIQGNAGAAVYSASKGGVSNLTRALALKLASETPMQPAAAGVTGANWSIDFGLSAGIYPQRPAAICRSA